MSSRYWLKQLVRQIGELSLILIYSVVSHFKVILHNHEYLNFAVNFSFSLRNFNMVITVYMTVDLMFYCNYNTDIGKVSAI